MTSGSLLCGDDDAGHKFKSQYGVVLRPCAISQVSPDLVSPRAGRCQPGLP